MMSQWSAYWFMTIYLTGMCYIWIEWLCIPRRPDLFISLLRYLNRIFQPTKLTVHLRYVNQFMSPHIQKIKIEMRVLCYYFNAPHIQKKRKLKWEYYAIIFSMLLTNAFSSLLSFPWFYFFARSFLFALIFPSPPVPLGMMLSDLPSVETCDSDCSPWVLVCVYPDVHHLGGKTQ